MTLAKIGRSMKKRENMRVARPGRRARFRGPAAVAAGRGRGRRRAGGRGRGRPRGSGLTFGPGPGLLEAVDDHQVVGLERPPRSPGGRRPASRPVTVRFSTTSSLPTTSRNRPAWSVPRARSGTSRASGFSSRAHPDPDEQAGDDHPVGVGEDPPGRDRPAGRVDRRGRSSRACRGAGSPPRWPGPGPAAIVVPLLEVPAVPSRAIWRNRSRSVSLTLM